MIGAIAGYLRGVLVRIQYRCFTRIQKLRAGSMTHYNEHLKATLSGKKSILLTHGGS